VRELQDIVDGLAEVLARPICVEDRRYRLVAHSAQQHFADAVRRDSILERRVDAPVIAYLRRLGVESADSAVAIPAAPELGMAARTCHPLRAHDALLGFLWILDGERALTGEDLAALAATAAAVSEDLWRRRERQDEERRLRRDRLRAVLRGDEDAPATALAGELGPGPFAVAVAAGDDALAQAARRRWAHGELMAGEHDGRAVVVAGVGAIDPRELAGVLVRAGAPTAAVGAPVAEVPALPVSLRQAEVATWAARADRRFGPVVAYADLGGWATVVELWLAAGRPDPPDHVEAIARHRAGDELLAAAEAVLDSSADMAAIAERLHVHRGTLYRRIERVQELTGLDLADGDDRLALHLGLRLRRLAHAG
jgi:hypothetical protein